MSSKPPFFRLTKLATGDFWEKKRANMDKGYDSYDIDSIVEYATKLEGKTLRQMTGLDAIADPHQRRGSFGNAVEEYYFKYPINSSQVPDFDKVGLELKTTPLKRNSSGELVAKERLVITNIDYMGIVNENFEESHFLKKTADVLLITYLYEKDKSPLDYTIELVARWGIPEEDFPRLGMIGRRSLRRSARVMLKIFPAATHCILKPAQKLRMPRSGSDSPFPPFQQSREHGRSRHPI